MKLNVNPTRMELLKLRRSIKLAKRGHKLLKDKEEQLLLEFRTLVDEIRKNRRMIETELTGFYVDVAKMKGIMDEETWKALIGRRKFKTKFSVETKRVFNIPVSEIDFHTIPEKLSSDYLMSPYHYHLLQKAKKMLKHLMKISFLENKLISFASEIERTRRRVNALEYVLIPNLEDTIRFISFKLNETERTSIVMLKHIQLTRQ
jgi:V/A-type H+/Na+-transporting ATPase subunit D